MRQATYEIHLRGALPPRLLERRRASATSSARRIPEKP